MKSVNIVSRNKNHSPKRVLRTMKSETCENVIWSLKWLVKLRYEI